MTVRVVTAVLLAAALLGAVLPAVDAGRAERTTTLVDGELVRFERAVDRVADEDPTRSGVPGARRSVTVRVPAGSWTAAPVSYLAIGGVPADTSGGDTGPAGTTRGGGPPDPRVSPGTAADGDPTGRTGTPAADRPRSGASAAGRPPGGTVVAYRVADRRPVVRRLDGPRIRVPDGPIVLVGGARQRLELGLVRGTDGRPVVVVRRT